MDSLQAILDMQLLAIEKTLLVANGHHQAEMGKEVEQLITHFGKSMTDLMQRMSKAVC